MSIGELARMWGISRQPALRYVMDRVVTCNALSFRRGGVGWLAGLSDRRRNEAVCNLDECAP